MNVCVYIYLYAEKRYTIGLAFMRQLPEVWEEQGRVTEPQVSYNCPIIAKPIVYAVYTMV